MRTIVCPKNDNSKVNVNDLNPNCPVFAYDKSNRLVGMIVKEPQQGYILKLAADVGSYGFSKSLVECIKTGETYDYTFKIN